MSKLKQAGSALTSIREKGKDLVTIVTHNAKVKAASLGCATGIICDDIAYILAHYIPQLTYSSGFQVPGYAEAGMHMDDLFVQSISLSMIARGIYLRDSKLVIKGATMAAGALLTSQYQCGPL
jgi:hypothetical protein